MNEVVVSSCAPTDQRFDWIYVRYFTADAAYEGWIVSGEPYPDDAWVHYFPATVCRSLMGMISSDRDSSERAGQRM